MKQESRSESRLSCFILFAIFVSYFTHQPFNMPLSMRLPHLLLSILLLGSTAFAQSNVPSRDMRLSVKFPFSASTFETVNQRLRQIAFRGPEVGLIWDKNGAILHEIDFSLAVNRIRADVGTFPGGTNLFAQVGIGYQLSVLLVKGRPFKPYVGASASYFYFFSRSSQTTSLRESQNHRYQMGLVPGFIHDVSDRWFWMVEIPVDLLFFNADRTIVNQNSSGEWLTDLRLELPNGILIKVGAGVRF